MDIFIIFVDFLCFFLISVIFLFYISFFFLGFVSFLPFYCFSLHFIGNLLICSSLFVSINPEDYTFSSEACFSFLPHMFSLSLFSRYFDVLNEFIF